MRRFALIILLGLLTSALVNRSYGASFEDGPDVRADASAQLANQVVQWNRTLLVILRTPGAQLATVHPTRSYAILHAAIYDAVNAIDRTHTPYAVHLTGVPRSASQDAAAAGAAHEVLVTLYPHFQALLDAQLLEEVPGIR